MMIIVNRIGDHITGSINGKPFGVAFTEQKYALMKQLELQAAQVETMEELQTVLDEFSPLTKEDYKELVEHAKGGQYLYVNQHTGKIFLKINDTISDIPLPQALVDRIVTSVEKQIDVLPLVKCWARFIREVPGRPKYTPQRGSDFARYIDADYFDEAHATKLMEEAGLSHEVAFARATTKQVAITQEGLLVCYKVSREILHRYELNEEEEVVQKSRYKKNVDPDTGVVTMEEPAYMEERLFEPWIMGQGGDEFHCVGMGINGSIVKKGHHIRVGCTHFLEDWSQVSAPGYKGLHCGGLRYIKGYQDGIGAVTHNIFVDPMDIHSIAGLGYGNDGAMTVKRYFVHSSFAGPNKGIYHSSKYAALTDLEFESLLQKAIEDHSHKVTELESKLAQQKNLL